MLGAVSSSRTPTREKVMALQSYRELRVWQAAMDFVQQVYELTAGFPADERYGLSSQLQRAAVSVPSNIAEGYGRLHRGEYVQHLGIARGSLFEAETQLILSVKLGLAPRDKVECLWLLAQDVGKMLWSLIESLRDPG
jgi:four helix bundle protein